MCHNILVTNDIMPDEYSDTRASYHNNTVIWCQSSLMVNYPITAI